MLIASDLDGTLLNNNSDISENNKEMVEKLIKDNHKFVIATGRIYPSALKYARELSLDTPVIACNGAVIMDHVNNKMIKDYPIKKEIMRELLSICEKYNVYFHLYSLDTVYGKENKKLIKRYLEWIASDSRFSEIKVEITDDIKSVIENETIYKLGLYLDDDISKEAYNEMIKVKGIQSCFSLTTLVDIFDEDASKGVALEYVSTYYNYKKEDTISLGDNENDIDMIKAAGIGVAMGNARDNVKEHANYITTDNESDGFKKAMEELVY